MVLWSGMLQKTIVDFFFPIYCVGCKKEGDFLCHNCLPKLPRILSPFCQKCGRPESTGSLCPTCWGWDAKIDGIRSPFRFDGIISQAIYQLKYHNLRAIAGYMAELLHNYLVVNPIPGDTLMSVPLHSKRLRQRGYNQSDLIAKKLSKLEGLQMIDRCLSRQKDNPPQTKTKNVEERRRNVVDAFICSDKSLSGKRVILIDDVCTSGATLEACAVALKTVGVSSVWGLTLARET